MTNDDLIRRGDVIDLVKNSYYDLAESMEDMWAMVADVEKLPSAQPESKTGKWIEKEVYETRRKEEMQVAKCSNCNKYLTTPYFYSFNHYNFCPNCGARMKGAKSG